MNKTKNFSNCMVVMSPATIEILSKHYSLTPEQREFGEKMDKLKKVAKTAGKVALGAAAVGAAAYGADRYLNGGKGMQALAKGASKVANSNVGQAAKNLGKATAQTAKNAADKAVDITKEGIKKADEKLKKGGAAAVDKTRSALHNATRKASDVTEQEMRNFSYTHLNTRGMSKETRKILTAYYNK